MDPKPELGSPIRIALPVRADTIMNAVPTEKKFIKYCHPSTSSMKQFFVGLEPAWSDIIEFMEDTPVGYLHKTSITGDTPVHKLKRTSHPNLVNLKEVFIADESAFFVYEKWGISLDEIRKLSPVFQLGEIEVATICREVLKGLSYIHKKVGISHGDLSFRNIYLMDEGNVKIANIGESMLARPNSRRKTKDIQMVCDLPRTLLGLNDAAAARGTTSLLAVDFTNAPLTATVDELLKHPFLSISTGSWCLRPANILSSIVRKFSG